MMPKLIATFLLISLPFIAIVESTVDAGISTRAVEAKGLLMCGKQPAVDVKVYLKRELTEGLDDIIGHAVTGDDGKFVIAGNTERFGGAKSTIDPVLIFYHKCERDISKSFATFNLRFPRTYTTIGKVSRRTYDIGTYNLQIKYPGQTDEKTAPEF